MGLKKGQTNNLKGRPVGALGKIAPELRKNIAEFLENNFDEVVKEWKQLEGKEKIQAYRDLLSYVLPKMQSFEIQNEFEALSDSDLQRIIDELKK